MEVVELKVQVEKSQLAALEKDIKALQSKRIKLSVDASGFDALSKSTQSAMRSVTQYVNAVTRAQEQETKLQVARERTAAATQQRMRAETNLARQVERTKTAQADATVQAQKTAQAQARVAQQMEKTKTAQAQYATQVEKTATAQAKAVNQTEKVSKSTSLLGDSLGNVAVKMAAWQVMGDLIATPIRALKEALDTMKAVDDQLVDVRKVTGFTETQMKALEEQSYATASAYGEAADEYLGSVAEFARAGYGEQAEALAELSTKTKIVGDTTAEVANQFLLSVDAAYQYQGSVEKLSAVLDGVNEIDNKYATSISNIAEGLGKVAPIASQAGVGVDELSAAIGTITAVTQRSGTEAATAFRALMLNIMGDTKTEIDEGVTWTTGEIAGLRDVLKVYASDVVAAADATGSLINPMEAIGALAQSMEDGVLTEQKLMEMVSDIGGKLRTSQLLALIQNWDMYESMLADFSNAAGSADKEINNAMDSWSRKAAVLKNTWTQFVQNMLSTNAIKGALDGVTSVIEALNTDFGQAAIKAVAFVAAFKGISTVFSALSPKLSGLVDEVKNFASSFSFISKQQGKVAALNQSFELLNGTMLANPIFWTVALGTALFSYFATLQTNVERLNESIEATKTELESLEGEAASLETKVESGEATKTESDRLKLLQQQISARQELIRLQSKQQLDLKYGFEEQVDTDAHGRTYRTKEGGGTQLQNQLDEYLALKKAQEEYVVTTENGVEATDAQRDAYEANEQKLAEMKISLLEAATDLNELMEASGGGSEAQKELYNALMEAVGGLDSESAAADGAADSTENVATHTGALAGAFNEAEGAISAGTAALEAYQEAVSGGDHDTNFKSYADAWNALNEEINAGRVNSERFWAAAELIYGQDALSKIDYNSDAVARWNKELNTLYSDADSAGAGLIQMLNNAADAEGNIKNETGEVIGTIKQLSDGSWDVDLPTENFEELAGAVGLSEGAFSAATQALQVWGDGFSMLDLDDIIHGIEEIGAIAEVNGKKLVNADLLTEQLELAGKTGKEIHDIYEQLDGVTINLSVEADAEDVVSALEEAELATRELDGTTITIDVQGLIDAGIEANYTKDQLSGIIEKAAEVDGVQFTGVDGSVISIQNALGLVQDSAAKTQTSLSEVGDTDTEPKIGADTTEFDSGVSKVKSDLAELANTVVTPAVKVSYSVAPFGGILSGLFGKSAEGSDNHPGGITLLGDEYAADGAPRPELVITKDSAFLVGREGPEFRNLPAGARVIPYGETKKILSRSGTVGDELYPAFAGGNIKLPGQYAGGSGSSSGSSGSSSSGSSKKSSSSGSSSSSSGKDARQEELEDQVKLLESELDLMEAQGRPARELAAKMREIQQALRAQANYMRSIGGDQTEINKLSKEWWDVQEDIKEAYQDEMESARDLLESQLELMENQGKSAEERIRKLEEIQDNLHEEAEYLRSIGASQEEINELSNEWWDIQKDIKKIQEDLWDELEEAVDKELERAREARDLELAALDKAKEKLDEERQAKEEKLTLEEKILAVQEAQAALANAQNERTIRTYNAATGQWEWVADANTVKSAEEALEDAEKDLADYKADLEYQAAVDAIEARREAIESAYEALEESWEDIIASVQEPTREISEILADLAKNGLPQMKAQIENIGKLLEDFDNYVEGAIGTTTGESYYGGGGMPSMDFSSDTTDYSALMDRAQTVEEFNHWASLREEKMEAQGIDPEAEGWRTNAEIFEEWKAKNPGWEAGVGSSAGILGGGSSGGSSSGSSSGVSSAVSGVASSIGSAIAGALGGGAKKAYDSGGVLEGLGGIKATREDEMILPPDVTAAMLSPAADATFQARLAELGVLYGAKSGPVTLPAGVSQSRDSHDHHGDSYTFGDVTLTEEQARGMTVYDLAQRSRSLGLYGWQH